MKKHINPFNLLQQNCFVLDSLTDASIPHSSRSTDDRYSFKTYVDCKETVVPDGLKIEYVEVPYDITPESVKSYAQSADYHNNLQDILSNPPPAKPGLKNVSELQQLLNSDTSVARELYAQLQARFASKTPPSKMVNNNKDNNPDTDNNPDNNNSEVNK